MGYYSDVAICLKKEDYNELARRSAEFEYDIVADATTTRFDDKDDVVIVMWCCFKWYEGYKEVDLVENFLYELNDQEKPYHYVRIGEDITDNEERCGEWHNGICCKIHMCRDIEIDI